MKRALVFLLFLILLACQPTPEVDAVKQKDTNVLIETVRNEEETGAAAIPARFRLDETVSRGNVRIHADVPIEVLSETGTFPVLRVERRYLSDDERLTIARRLLSSDALYVWEYRETRASVAVQIAEYMRELSPEEKAAWMRETDSTEEDYEEMLARRKALAEQYQKRYNELPEDEALSPLAPWDGSVPAYSEDIANHRNEITIVRSDADTGVLWSLDYVEASANGGNSPLTFAAAQNDGADSTNVWFFNQTDKPGVERIARSDFGMPYAGARISPDEAIETVLSVFEGINAFAVSDVYWANNADTAGEEVGGVSVKNVRYAYLIHLSTVYGGAGMPYCGATAFDEPDGAGYVIPWDYETLMAVVDWEGNLLSLTWRAPLRVTETIRESAALLPVEQIAEIVTAQLGRMFTLTSEVRITSVQLGLFRIREKNDLASGLLVPVWYFLGEFQPTDAQTGAGGEIVYYDGLNPLLIVNAIDGSIIDPQKGY